MTQSRLAVVARLRRQGFSVRATAERLHVTAATIYADLVKLRRGGLQDGPLSGRPLWSLPDALLLAEAHDGRREIEQREGMRRPSP